MTAITFWGTSDSRGVPRLLCTCDVCIQRVPRNVRMRPSISVHTTEGPIQIDVSPDFRQQFLQFSSGEIPRNVLITHLHNDHIAGLGDFGDLCFWHHAPARIFSPEEMITGLQQKFAHLTPKRGIEMVATRELQLAEWQITFHQVQHGANGYSYAIRFTGRESTWTYMPDAFQVTDEQFKPLQHSDLLILGAAYWKEQAEPHRRSIYDVEEALAIKQRFGIRHMVLTHLSHDIDIPRYAERLPDGVMFAFDGLVIQLEALLKP